jgi:hypothetical protein
MCMFTRPVESVSGTEIFARMSEKQGRQFLVYSMTFSASEDLAMVLPIPVPKNSKDDAVRFVNLEHYGHFFIDLEAGFFHPPPPRTMTKGLVASSATLPIVEVGSFEASFVPGLADFARLDPRFRLPQSAWDQLPQYRDFGFTVFKLKKDASTVHPMAFDFPTADPSHLFFPTVHVHDGRVHATAHFDHTLYCQHRDSDASPILAWEESKQPASQFMNMKLALGLVDPEKHCYKLKLRGEQKNQDTLV